jgi:hypothetical protein
VVRYVRQQNLDVLGETADLNEFLFGSERNNLAQVRPVLLTERTCYEGFAVASQNANRRGDLHVRLSGPPDVG